MREQLGYNYVFFGCDDVMYRSMFADIAHTEYSVYIPRQIDSKSNVLLFLNRLHTSITSNKIIKLPFQNIWYPVKFKNKFRCDKPICFVFILFGNTIVDFGYVRYLRKHYPNAKFVGYYQDMVDRGYQKVTDELRSEFDLIISFDQSDSEQYSLIYHPLIYSDVNVPNNSDIEQSDVFFVGVAKNRLDDIISAYERLRDAGLKCDFHICGVAEGDRRYTNEIHYRGKMPYVENLQRIKASRCLLEIMQKGGHGYTLRACEAITLGRKLLTNNPEVTNAPFYSSKCISSFTTPDTIDIDFVKSGDSDVDYKYKDMLSPLHLLKFIEQKLDN